jgi:ribulose-phosphate 3-epimerase
VSLHIAPSILAADFARLADEIARVESAGADELHVDVMDGHFVPNLTIGPPVVAAIRRVTTLPLDVHLMIDNPDKYLEAFAAAGAFTLSIHIEAVTEAARTLGRIRELGVRAGLAISPDTPLSAIADLAGSIDHLLVMSVYPGFTGQSFLPLSVQRVADARALLASRSAAPTIGVDGGVNTSNASALVGAGATLLVAGAAIFHASDCALALRTLRAAALNPL